MDILVPEWPGQSGACWECWKLEPCCGEPCNSKDGVHCFLCFACPIVGCFSTGKLYSYSQNQEYQLVNHCLGMLIPIVSGTSLRHNIRVKNNIGKPAMDHEGILGDGIMMFFCGACSGCQILRSVSRETWDWHTEYTAKGFQTFKDPCIFCVAKT